MPTNKGANAGLKVASLVAGMVGGADSVDDMALLRHGGMGRVGELGYAPSTLGSFLRAFTFGHAGQLDAVASRFLTALDAAGPAAGRAGAGRGGFWSMSTVQQPHPPRVPNAGPHRWIEAPAALLTQGSQFRAHCRGSLGNGSLAASLDEYAGPGDPGTRASPLEARWSA